MADLLDATGLQTKTLTEIIEDLEEALKDIYGDDINIDSNSPDGQLINILAQQARDMRELLTTIYNSFDPDNAIGTVLDQRVAINNIQRQGGTYTIQPIDITVDRTVELQGLDADFSDPDGTGYTVQDDAGNEFILIDTTTFLSGVTTKNFRAKEIGQVETVVGTITTPVTVVLGVTSINNSSAALQTGVDQETDAQLRTRRQYSVANAAQGYLNGLQGDLLQLDGVTEAIVYENYTSTTDSNGIPAHSIWAIVEGGANTDIANTIYGNKSYGAGMKGSTTVDVTTPANTTFTAAFDRPSAANLHIRFDIQDTIAGTSYDQSVIKSYIVTNLIYTIGEAAETSRATAVAVDAINSQGGGGVPVNMEVSDDGATWVDYLEVSTLDEQYTLDASRITITEL